MASTAVPGVPAPAAPADTPLVSHGRIAAAVLYWVGYLVARPRGVVNAGTAREIDILGAGALRLVSASALLLGLIGTFQLGYQLQQFGAESMSARAMGWFTWREIGPLVVAMLVITRSASAIAGELAAMTASAEIDALRAMGLDPVKYLIAPKVAALLLALPALTIVADGLIIVGAWIGTTGFLGFNTRYFLEELRAAFVARDLVVGLGKSLLFAFIIGVVAATQGLNVQRGAGAIGDAASRAVVFCLLGVLAADTFVNAVIYFIPAFVY